MWQNPGLLPVADDGKDHFRNVPNFQSINRRITGAQRVWLGRTSSHHRGPDAH